MRVKSMVALIMNGAHIDLVESKLPSSLYLANLRDLLYAPSTKQPTLAIYGSQKANDIRCHCRGRELATTFLNQFQNSEDDDLSPKWTPSRYFRLAPLFIPETRLSADRLGSTEVDPDAKALTMEV